MQIIGNSNENRLNIKMQEKWMGMLQFHDDIALVAPSAEEIKKALHEMKIYKRKCYMQMNQQRSKVFVCRRKQYVKVGLE